MNPNDPNNHDPLNFDDDDMLSADQRNGDDFDQDDEPRGVSLAEIWRNNPSLKIFAVVLVIGIFLIVFLVFGGEEEANPSTVKAQSTVNQPPGTAQLPPAYEDAVKTASEQRATNAELTGGSALPTPIGTAERIEAPPSVENIDPLAEWRRAAEQRARQRRDTDAVNIPAPPPVELPPLQQPQQNQQPAIVQQQPKAPPPLPTGPNAQEVDRMSQALAKQMQAILESQTPRAATVVGLNIPTGFDLPKEQTAQAQNGNTQASTTQSAQQQQPKAKIIIPAGTIGYAQTIVEANSDVPGPVVAELASGPLSGARLLGSFQVQDDYLTLKFNRAVYKGKEYSIDAYALDPATTLPGMATDVDHHYTSRILIPAAARFLQGYAQAITQRGTTVVVNNNSTLAATEGIDPTRATYRGAAEAVNQASQIIQQDAGRRPVTVKVASGTRMGLLFVSSVTDKSGDDALAGTPAYQQAQDAAQAYTRQAMQQQPGLNTQPATSTTVAPAAPLPVTSGQDGYYPASTYPSTTRIVTPDYTPLR